MIQELKCLTEFFEKVWNGEKSFELRRNDRDFQVGQKIFLLEFDSVAEKYSGRQIRAHITYIFSGDEHQGFGLLSGYVILSFEIYSRIEPMMIDPADWKLLHP